MQALFDALEDRFDADDMMVLLGRKLYQGLEGERAERGRPFVDVTFFGPTPMDTFKADIEEYTVRFSCFTQKHRPAEAAKQKEALMRVFDDCDLYHGAIHVAGFLREAAHGPVLRDGAYQSTVEYRALVQRVVKSPVVRGV